MVDLMLQLVGDLTRGGSGARRHRSISDYVHEANSMMPLAFSELFGGDANLKMQRLMVEMKLCDAVMGAALAPYNRTRGDKPFERAPGSGLPRAVQKFLYVVVQRAVYESPSALAYFAKQSSRTWASAAAVAGRAHAAAGKGAGAGGDHAAANADGAKVSFDGHTQVT